MINPPLSIALACMLTALLFLCFFFFHLRRYPERQLALAAATGSGGETGTIKLAAACGLNPAVIAAFTTFTYSDVKDIKIGQQVLECAVCLNEFQDHEALRLLPECNHLFHRECIDEWLTLHITCPVCRASLVPKLGQLSESSCSQNRPREEDECVSIEVIDLIHDARRLSRSYSLGHLVVGGPIENIERYTLRLPEDVQNVLKNSVNKSQYDYLTESSLKKCLRSASASFFRESNYFSYERFGQERRLGDGNFE